MTPKEALKGNKVRVYLRVSTTGQEGTLPDQEKTVLSGLKSLGFKGKPEIYSEQASGTKKDRKELLRMLQDIRDSPKESVVVVRDFQRFTRDPVHYGALWDEFRDRGIRIVSINENLATGTAKNVEPQADLLVPILIAAGGSEVNIRKEQTQQGLDRSKEKGILQGSAPLFYRKEPLEPRRELRRMLQAGLGVLETSRRIGKSTSFVRKNRDKMQTILIEGNESSLQDWLDTLDLIRAYMNEKDEDDRGSKATKRMKTVVRMVSGYLNNPNAGFPKPTRADIEEYYNNFGLYKVKKKR
jgi:DNA invertase Pin-like site-specific DNA recombinase